MRKSFIQAYLKIAKSIAEDRSEDFFTKVGAVATDEDNNILGTSYNGTLKDYKFSFDPSLEENRGRKNLLMLHGEENLILRLRDKSINEIYLTHSPCRNCAKLLAGAGVKVVYYIEEYHRDQDFKFIFSEYGVKFFETKIDNEVSN